MAEPTAARDQLLSALEADLIGPFSRDPEASEVLPLPPARWYLTGFLAPEGARETGDPTDDEEAAAGSDEDAEEAGSHEPEPKQRNRFPASMGMSVLLPAGARAVRATVRWAEYVCEEGEKPEGKKRARLVWRRVALPAVTVEVPLDARALADGVAVAERPGVRLEGKLGATDAPGLPAGTQALSLFVVNRRAVVDKGRENEQFLFQVSLEVSCEEGLVARPNRRDERSGDWDDRVADLQFRDRFEYAVGHGVSVEAPPEEGPVRTVRTCWIPRAEVPRVVTHRDDAVTTAMEALAELADGEAAERALGPLVSAYGEWIEAQRRIDVGAGPRAEARDQLMDEAENAKRRIAEGIALLAKDAEVLEAFRLANRAMAMSARQRSPGRYEAGARPEWRLFQLAFLLLNLASVADETHEDRENVELIFFPTGGGKTEAYLGVIAFALVLRRLRGQAREDRGLGVAVLLRYTLRLLTLDQLGRAATLVCALERIRQERPERLGDVRFSVGLWVGRSATANTMADARQRILDYKNAASRSAASPFPLTHCPWCGSELNSDSLTLEPSPAKPTEVMVGCSSFRCEFARAKNREGLPVLFVDEQIYRELPCFVVATVDKFAMMPWRGETGMLFGRVTARQGRVFYGPMDRPPKSIDRLVDGVRLPELIVQDELHLISGPLGTMVGLYETAIEALCSREVEGRTVRPKILASTATVRRARHQIRALFGRDGTALFPPPGVDDNETYFATVDREEPGRLYCGIAASGKAMKAILLRTYVSLLGAAYRLYDEKGPPEQTADAYMTVAGYFNSLRELGGMRRLVEDEVRARCAQLENRRPLGDGGPHPWFRNRDVQPEPVELTSRESTGKIAESKARLSRPWAEKDHVDVLLASNMISVGVDIDRLGLMVIGGQPKTTSEYIQASSRVGRQAKWPGLVVTCFNLHKPRDRSHYEHFAYYHDSFYRAVEAQSLTPFSGPALSRGLAGTLVAMARLLDPALTPPEGAMRLGEERKWAEEAVRRIADRAARQPGVRGGEDAAKRDRLLALGKNLLDAWESLILDAKKGAASRSYSRFDRDKSAGKPILRTALDDERPDPGSDEEKFVAPTSMRDVEPTVHLWLERRMLGGKR